MDLVSPSIGLIFWQSVVFLLTFFLLRRFAWKPILASLHEREHSIEASLKAAHEARVQMEKLQADNQKLIADANAERDRILAEARAAANRVVSEAREEAKVRVNQDIDKAQAEIAQFKSQAIAEMKNQAASLSLDMAEKLLRHNLENRDAQLGLVNQYLNEAKTN